MAASIHLPLLRPVMPPLILQCHCREMLRFLRQHDIEGYWGIASWQCPCSVPPCHGERSHNAVAVRSFPRWRSVRMTWGERCDAMPRHDMGGALRRHAPP